MLLWTCQTTKSPSIHTVACPPGADYIAAAAAAAAAALRTHAAYAMYICLHTRSFTPICTRTFPLACLHVCKLLQACNFL